jgi:hypothetical protein
MRHLADQIQSGDFSSLAGARLDLSVPIKEEHLLRAAQEATSRGGPARVTGLRVHANNQVEMHLEVEKWGFKQSLSTVLEVERNLGFPHAPRLVLWLPPAQAWLGGVLQVLSGTFGLGAGVLHAKGRQITLDFAAGAPDDNARALLKAVKWAEIDSREGRLILNARLEMDEDEVATPKDFL